MNDSALALEGLGDYYSESNPSKAFKSIKLEQNADLLLAPINLPSSI